MLSMGHHPDDPEGIMRVRLGGVREGAWQIRLQLDANLEASENPVRVSSGEAAPTVVIAPVAGRVPLRVRVVAAGTLEPISNAEVGYLRTLSDAGSFAKGEDHWFVSEPVSPGIPLTLVAGAPDYQHVAERFVPSPEGDDVVLELTPGWRERVIVVNLTTTEFEADVGVFADGVEVGRTDGDGALWLSGDSRPATLEVATDDPALLVSYSAFKDFQQYGELPIMGWVFGVTRP